MEPLLTTEEIAEYLRVEVVTVRRLTTRGELPAYRIGGEFRFIAQDVEGFVKSQRVVNDERDSRFDKFTERSRKVLSFADIEAATLGHHYIGTEHLLLGIVREGESVAALALVRSGLNLKDVREKTLDITPKSDRSASPETAKPLPWEAINEGYVPDPSGDRGMTRRAKKVIELAVEEARSLKHHYIGTEHLLLAILREGEGLAARVLRSYGLQLETERALIMQILQEKAAISLPKVPEQATTLLSAEEEGIICGRCAARSPEYFRYCFHCGLKFP